MTETNNAAAPFQTTTERAGDTDLVVTRTFNGPARFVFEAWSKPELLMRWWVPKSFGITFLSCEADVRTGGTYRFVFAHPASDQPMAFYGRYLDVKAPERIVWTNEESDEGSVTTLTLKETNGRTLLTLRDVYASKQALDAAIESGSTGAHAEQFDSLDLLLTDVGAFTTA